MVPSIDHRCRQTGPLINDGTMLAENVNSWIGLRIRRTDHRQSQSDYFFCWSWLTWDNPIALDQLGGFGVMPVLFAWIAAWCGFLTAGLVFGFVFSWRNRPWMDHSSLRSEGNAENVETLLRTDTRRCCRSPLTTLLAYIRLSTQGRAGKPERPFSCDNWRSQKVIKNEITGSTNKYQGV